MHRLPPEPAYLRVKVRRRLARIGARLVKNSVYVLPGSDEALEDFQWLAGEIAADGGEALVCEASFVAGITDAELRALFVPRTEARGGPGEGAEEIEPGSTWVTREGVFVDRIASAWLIRRFIDPKARFKFAPSRGYQPEPGELRFDMYEAEYTHEGGRCTFETLLRRFRLKDRALRTIGEIVHDIDCKDDRFGRPEAAGVATILRGVTRACPDDAGRLARGGAVFDDLYSRFRTGQE
ncbi:MAG: chromate resistance protein ChrB domain-containing protein [Gemmatimonadales bacterium]